MRHGSQLDPPNPYQRIQREPELDHLAWDEEYLHALTHRHIEYIDDDSQNIVSENNSPDIPFRYSLNPYRGCIHACAYCYARPTHEFLGFNAGLDFETKIVVKRRAPELLRKFLASETWSPEPITFSGVTDCYQPAERRFRLTRQCLEVALEYGQPVSVVTKNALVVRDIDLLEALAAKNLVHVFVSITTLNPPLARDMEPRTSIPTARLRAISMLSEAGVPAGVMVAPIIPGLNDFEIPAILREAKASGAAAAGYVLLRLPRSVEPVFVEWLNRTQASHAEKVLGRVRNTRDGKLNSSAWGERMVGSGQMAAHIENTFHLYRRRYGLETRLAPLSRDRFQAPLPKSGQLRLF